MRKWLARLSFSFLVLAAVFAWEGSRTQRGDRGAGQPWQTYALFAAAAICFGLGLRGIQERHQQADDDAGEGGDTRRNDSETR